MPQRIDRDHLRAIADANPHAGYRELERLSGYHHTSISRILREEFDDVRCPRLVVVSDFDDFRRGASFAQQEFLECAWERIWPYGLRLRDGRGDVFVVRGFMRKYTWRQRLVGAVEYIEPVSCSGGGRRVGR